MNTCELAKRAALIIVIGVLVPQTLCAQVSVFPFRGMLEIAGVPVDGEVDFRYEIWSDAVGGIRIQTSSDTENEPGYSKDVLVVNGQFVLWVQLEDNARTKMRQSTVFLELWVSPSPFGESIALTPRRKLLTVPYALIGRDTDMLPVGSAMWIRTDEAPPPGWLSANGDRICAPNSLQTCQSWQEQDPPCVHCSSAYIDLIRLLSSGGASFSVLLPYVSAGLTSPMSGGRGIIKY